MHVNTTQMRTMGRKRVPAAFLHKVRSVNTPFFLFFVADVSGCFLRNASQLTAGSAAQVPLIFGLSIVCSSWRR